MAGKLDWMSAIKAGLLGTAIMTLVMYGLPLIGLPPMDIMAALGAVFPFAISPYILGFLIHFAIGTVLALIYGALFYSWLPGPGWVRGALFSILPWLYAITLLTPSLELAARVMGGGETQVAVNPCAPRVANPCAAKAPNPCAPKANNPCAPKAVNPCAVKPSANPCAPQAVNPCATKPANPCAAKAANPCAVNPCGLATNPCAVKPANPCAPKAVNPCAPSGQAAGGVPPQVLSLIAHLIYGAVLGVFYRPRG